VLFCFCAVCFFWVLFRCSDKWLLLAGHLNPNSYLWYDKMQAVKTHAEQRAVSECISYQEALQKETCIMQSTLLMGEPAGGLAATKDAITVAIGSPMFTSNSAPTASLLSSVSDCLVAPRSIFSPAISSAPSPIPSICASPATPSSNPYVCGLPSTPSPVASICALPATPRSNPYVCGLPSTPSPVPVASDSPLALSSEACPHISSGDTSSSRTRSSCTLEGIADSTSKRSRTSREPGKLHFNSFGFFISLFLIAGFCLSL
jgi:hypothetical protein